jgi:hypothetical protein
MNVNEEISRRRIPCGPVTVSANGVCRRRLRDIFDKLLDRLSVETTQEYKPPQSPKDHTIDDGKVIHNDVSKAKTAAEQKQQKEKEKQEATPSRAEKKKQMLNDAKDKAEVKIAAKSYEEKLTGNSKLLQNLSGKIKKH